jgi:hypothetical protein
MWRTASKGKKAMILAINVLFIAGIVVVGQQMRYQNLAATNSVAQTADAAGETITVASTFSAASKASTPPAMPTIESKPSSTDIDLPAAVKALDPGVKIAIVAMFFLMLMLTVYWIRH